MVHAASALPVLWCHGTVDREIPLSYAEDALEFLHRSIGIPRSTLKLKTYNGLAHSINDEELEDIISWVDHILGQNLEDFH